MLGQLGAERGILRQSATMSASTGGTEKSILIPDAGPRTTVRISGLACSILSRLTGLILGLDSMLGEQRTSLLLQETFSLHPELRSGTSLS